MWLALMLMLARAEMPLPSYREEMVREEWYAIDELIGAKLYEEAEKRGVALQRQAVEDGSIEYLVGRSWRLRDDPQRAEKHFRRALELAPDYATAWYDLGEVLLIRGEFEEAGEAFAKVSELRPDS